VRLALLMVALTAVALGATVESVGDTEETSALQVQPPPCHPPARRPPRVGISNPLTYMLTGQAGAGGGPAGG